MRPRPSTSNSMDCPRSPLATAPMVRAISVVGRTRSSMSVLIESTFAAHWPIAPGRDMRCLRRPSRPTVTLNRSTSRVSRSSCATAWLKASAIRPSVPAQSDGNRHEKSPSRNAIIAASIIFERLSELSGDESEILFRLWRGFSSAICPPDRGFTGVVRTVVSLIVHPLGEIGNRTDAGGKIEKGRHLRSGAANQAPERARSVWRMLEKSPVRQKRQS